jgi:hypothetical protein
MLTGCWQDQNGIYGHILIAVYTEKYLLIVGRVARSVLRMTTGWPVRGSNPGGARFSAPVQTGPGSHPASCTMGICSFPGVESGLEVTLTPHPLLVSSSRKRVELYLYSP